jgi:hypothetical protein
MVGQGAQGDGMGRIRGNAQALQELLAQRHVKPAIDEVIGVHDSELLARQREVLGREFVYYWLRPEFHLVRE